MPSTTTLLQFAVASFLLAVVPGPSVVLLLAVGTERGRLAAILTAGGLAIGTTAWVVVVAAGLGAVLAARPDAIDAITAVGGGYLLWLARRAMQGDDHRVDTATPARDERVGRDVTDGLVVNLLNPSIALFLAALLPGFVDPTRSSPWQQVLALGGVLVLVSTVVNAGWAVVGAAIGRRVRRAAGSRVATVAVTATYAGLGLLALWTALG